MFTRTRRLRRNFLTRELVKNISIEKSSLIYPLFVYDGENIKSEIESMPEQYRYSLDRLNEELDELLKLGINNILLFGIPNCKDEIGSQAYDENGIVQRAVRQIRRDYQDKFLVVTDVCMCEYTSHGHCGILHNHDVDNDETLEYIAKIALSHAKAGADIIAPSDMMDGRIAKIREVLDKNNYKDIPIMAYSVKYSSAYYGPFRDAADSAPSFGDRKTYQMDFRSYNNFYREVEADIQEGADFIMVKPAMAYLDVIKSVSEVTNLPIVAYYGPFRDAADSAPSFGDRKTYQMDFRSYNNFYREVEADTQEGADFIMVKPAMAYLDVIKSVSEVSNFPIVAYNVSGEYSMVKAAAKNNWIDEQKIVMENMYAIKRAGADIIITYHAKDIAKWLSK